MEIISLIIAIVSLLFCAYIYIRYDKKLKEQQMIINAYELNKIKKETFNYKKADVRAYITNLTIGNVCSATLVIRNSGKADAKSIRMFSHDVGVNMPAVYDVDLPPQCQIEYPFQWPFGHGGDIDATIFWNDEFGENQHNKCILHL